MNGEHPENGERDWRDDPGSSYKMLDELSREEILRALADLDERLRTDAEDAYSLLARGLLHSKLGDDRQAVKDFSRVIELEPDNAEAPENRAAARDALGEHHLAREDYDAVIRLEPDNAVALYSRGACLAQLGDLAGGNGPYSASTGGDWMHEPPSKARHVTGAGPHRYSAPSTSSGTITSKPPGMEHASLATCHTYPPLVPRLRTTRPRGHSRCQGAGRTPPATDWQP